MVRVIRVVRVPVNVSNIKISSHGEKIIDIDRSVIEK